MSVRRILYRFSLGGKEKSSVEGVRLFPAVALTGSRFDIELFVTNGQVILREGPSYIDSGV